MKTPKTNANGVRRRDVLAGAAGAASFLIIRPGTAKAAKWPEKPISIVIMYAAGGGTDILMRLLANEMAAATGWTIEPLNKPGAVGGIATNFVLKEPADGYTLLGAANFNKFVRVMGHTTSKQWEDWTTMQAAAAPGDEGRHHDHAPANDPNNARHFVVREVEIERPGETKERELQEHEPNTAREQKA